MKLGEAMYKASRRPAPAGRRCQGGAGGAGGAAGSREAVVDADFEEVDDDKKKRGSA